MWREGASEAKPLPPAPSPKRGGGAFTPPLWSEGDPLKRWSKFSPFPCREGGPGGLGFPLDHCVDFSYLTEQPNALVRALVGVSPLMAEATASERNWLVARAVFWSLSIDPQ